MAYVYKYTDLLDNVVKYVGIVWGKTRTLQDRIKEHIVLMMIGVKRELGK